MSSPAQTWAVLPILTAFGRDAELMLLGFISLLLTVSQGVIQRTCIPPSWTNYMLPCKKMDAHTVNAKVLALGARRLLSKSGPRSEHCQNKVDIPWAENSASCFNFFYFSILFQCDSGYDSCAADL
jgi:hypothetical protein